MMEKELAELRLKEQLEEQRLRAVSAAAELRRQQWHTADDPPPSSGLYETATWLDRNWYIDHLLYRDNTETWTTRYGMTRSPHCWRFVVMPPLSMRPR